MNAQAATKQATAPQTPPLPQARPESLGLSPTRLARMSDAFKREIDKGTMPGVTVMVARRGQIGWFEALGRQNPAQSAPMTRDSIFRIFSMTKPIVSIGIMQLVEDGYLAAQRAAGKIHSGIFRTEGRRREQRQARPRAAGAADHHPGSAAAHLRAHQRHRRQRPGAADVPAIQDSRPQHQQRRTCGHRRRHAADLPARRGVELQPLHRHSGPHHRDRLRQVAERLSDRAHSGAAADDRDRVPHRRRRTRTAWPSRSRTIRGPASR